MTMLPSTSVPAFNDDEAQAFKDAIGPVLWERLTVFPLWGFTDSGCDCPRPECKNAGKHPAVKWGPESWPDGHKASTREDGVGTGAGLATGQRSGGIVVIDVDMPQGRDSLRDLEARLGRLPETLRVDSPSGGYHLYFLTPRRLESSASVVAPKIDIRAEGGYVVLPGSPHRKGGHYRVEIDSPVAVLPEAWAREIGQSRPPSRPLAAIPEATSITPETLRQRVHDAAKGRRGDEWTAWRAAVIGERMFRIEGAPDCGGPLVIGVDEFLTKRLIWSLANTGDFYTVPAVDMAALVAPSLSILREDADAVGTGSKWTAEHFADRWDYTARKVAADREAAADLVRRMTEAAAGTDPRMPLIVQLDAHYWILDDRKAPPRYVGPHQAVALVGMCAQIWGDRRVLDVPTKAGVRPMKAPEAVEAYGRFVSQWAIEYMIDTPRVEDLTLVLPPSGMGPRPAPLYDQAVADWLAVLDDTGGLAQWLAHAGPEQCGDSLPALALIGGADVGKTLIAAATARAAGMATATPLGRALGKFAGDVLGDGPILFGDEGIPKDPRSGVPMTEEFRDLVTRSVHKSEVKGISKSLMVRGGVRVILAANRLDRLFSNRGQYSSDDVAAITRRLFAVELHDPARVLDAKRRAAALGSSTLDPRRLERVAGHIRHLQANPGTPPAARAGSIAGALRGGGDTASEALTALSDRVGACDWIGVDERTLWYKPDALARAVAVSPPALARALAPYMTHRSEKMSRHPVTLEPFASRERWAGLDLVQLRLDGHDF